MAASWDRPPRPSCSSMGDPLPLSGRCWRRGRGCRHRGVPDKHLQRWTLRTSSSSLTMLVQIRRFWMPQPLRLTGRLSKVLQNLSRALQNPQTTSASARWIVHKRRGRIPFEHKHYTKTSSRTVVLISGAGSTYIYIYTCLQVCVCVSCCKEKTAAGASFGGPKGVGWSEFMAAWILQQYGPCV